MKIKIDERPLDKSNGRNAIENSIEPMIPPSKRWWSQSDESQITANPNLKEENLR